MSENTRKWDAFVLHAPEDREALVRPLADALDRLGARIWFDDVSLGLGDSFSDILERGVSRSHQAILFISPAIIGRNWSKSNSDAIARYRAEKKLKLLPIWHAVDEQDVANWSPVVSDFVALETAGQTPREIVIDLLAHICPTIYEAQGRSQLENLATGEAYEKLAAVIPARGENGRGEIVPDVHCPFCGASLVDMFDPNDRSNALLVDVDVFECGHVSGGSKPQACPADPAFPSLSDYELGCAEVKSGVWICFANPKTAASIRHHLNPTVGSTKHEAEKKMMENYKNTKNK